MGRVQKLSDELANQIAAGEVVERPASVVKELVENALDANATRVAVDVEHGGTALVRVTDDGDGMTREDALLAVERHATSKIRALEDLFRLHTFGFRGEALPSIASVSRLVLRTRVREARGGSVTEPSRGAPPGATARAGEGCEIEIQGGRAPAARPAGGATGTTIEVRDLFFNVPARRKFLKATATESAHIGDVVLGAALARPDVTFTLSRDGRTVREYLRVATRAERARAATGGSAGASATGAGEALAHVVAERGPLRIEAMLAPPERARAGATGLSLLVNGRPVRDRVLARAVAHAYGSVLDGGRYPVGVVWLDLPTELVDVNVHPQKAEVRFTDARGVFDAITRELHAVLARAFGLPDLAHHNPFAQARLAAKALEASRGTDAATLAPPTSTSAYGELFSRREPAVTPAVEGAAGPPRSGRDVMDAAPPSYMPGASSVPYAPVAVAAPVLLPEENLFAVAEPRGALGERGAQGAQHVERSLQPGESLQPGGSPQQERSLEQERSVGLPDREAPASASSSRRAAYGALRFVGQVRGTFLLCEGDDGVYVLDQHAAAERVTFDRLRRSYTARAMSTQRLLVPEVVELPPADVATLEEQADDVARLGVEVRAVGDGAVAVHAVPALLVRASPARVVRDLAAELSRAGGRAFGGAVDLVLATMACHGSIRAGDAVSPEEVRALLAALDDVDFAGHCPHGRPVVMRLGWGELERRVGR